MNDENAELIALTEGYCNGTLSDNQFERLEGLLLSDPAARADFRRYMALDAALRDHGSIRLNAARPADHAKTVVGRPHSSPQRRWKLRIIGMAAAAIVGVVVLAMSLFVQPNADAKMIGTLVNVTGDVRIKDNDGQIHVVEAAAPIEQGDTVSTRGSESSTVLAYLDGTRLTLVGSTSVTFQENGTRSVVVHEGTLAAAVQPQSAKKPLLLTTPSARLHVLGTRFQVEAGENRTDLSVTEGRVRLVRTRDSKVVDVTEGKFASVTDKNGLVVEDIPSLATSWEHDFESGLPDGWIDGEWMSDGLPPGSRGAVKATFRQETDEWSYVNITTNDGWLRGLFDITKDSHLHFTFKIAKRGWINVFVITRTPDPDAPLFSGNYLYDNFPSVRRGEWHTATIPLAMFKRIHRGKVPIDEVIPYRIAFNSDQDRGLVVDRIWVTPDGPGEVVVRKVEQQ
jgi:ferric-dicitrate binding protein FerR (iron transport regulator)